MRNESGEGGRTEGVISYKLKFITPAPRTEHYHFTAMIPVGRRPKVAAKEESSNSAKALMHVWKWLQEVYNERFADYQA